MNKQKNLENPSLNQTSPSKDGADVVSSPAIVEAKLLKWFPDIDGSTVKKLTLIHTELTSQTRTLQLIANQSVRNAEGLHIADAILGAKLVLPRLHANHPLYDFGGGNGLPGLIFALLEPARKVIALEKDQKRAQFCSTLASKLGLSNFEVVAKSLEECPAASVHNLISRGFGPLQKAMLLARKPLALQGRYFQMKTDSWSTELAAVPSQFFSFWSPSLLGRYKIPETSQDMAVVLIDKIAD